MDPDFTREVHRVGAADLKALGLGVRRPDLAVRSVKGARLELRCADRRFRLPLQHIVPRLHVESKYVPNDHVVDELLAAPLKMSRVIAIVVSAAAEAVARRLESKGDGDGGRKSIGQKQCSRDDLGRRTDRLPSY